MDLIHIEIVFIPTFIIKLVFMRDAPHNAHIIQHEEMRCLHDPCMSFRISNEESTPYVCHVHTQWRLKKCIFFPREILTKVVIVDINFRLKMHMKITCLFAL